MYLIQYKESKNNLSIAKLNSAAVTVLERIIDWISHFTAYDYFSKPRLKLNQFDKMGPWHRLSWSVLSIT